MLYYFTIHHKWICWQKWSSWDPCQGFTNLVHRFNNNNDMKINWISLSQSDHWIAIKRWKNADHQLMESNISTRNWINGVQHCLYILPKNLIKIPFMHIIENGRDFFLQITIAEMHYHTRTYMHPKWDRHIRMTKMNCH